MKRVLVAILFACLCLCALPAAAQMTPAQGGQAMAATANPLSTTLKAMWDGIKRNLSESAEKMPEAEYAFKPTPEVRSFGQILGHVANSHYAYCSMVKGEKNPNQGNDLEKVTAKADLVKALNESIAYCDGVYGTMTDAAVVEMVKVGQGEKATQAMRGRPLIGNISHDNEHYGNIVTYLRIKGIVPPSTERAQRRDDN